MTSTDTITRPERPAPNGADPSSPARTVRVVLVDDCEIVRHGLRDLLDDAGGFEVVGEAGAVAEATSRITATAPDLVVLDVRLPDGSGLDLCRALRRSRPDAACVVLTAFDDDDLRLDAIGAGATGVLLKAAHERDLVPALRRAAAGESLFDQGALRRAADRQRADSDEHVGLRDLSDQQRRVVELVGEGLTNRQIADRLHLAEKTIKNYVSIILTSLGMQRRTEVAALAARLDERRRRRPAAGGWEVSPGLAAGRARG